MKITISKKYAPLFAVLMTAVVLTPLSIMYNWDLITKPAVKVGQIWVDCWLVDNDNPFNVRQCEKKEVLALKDGYIEYKEDSWTYSTPIRHFLRSSHLIKRENNGH